MYFEESEETQEMVISADRLEGLTSGRIPFEDATMVEILVLKEMVREIVEARVYH